MKITETYTGYTEYSPIRSYEETAEAAKKDVKEWFENHPNKEQFVNYEDYELVDVLFEVEKVEE